MEATYQRYDMPEEKVQWNVVWPPTASIWKRVESSRDKSMKKSNGIRF